MALYDAFSATAFGGSQAAIISDAANIPFAQRQRIAREIGMPATAFIDACGDNWVRAQFLSTVMELPMCGHGTLCLATHLTESGHFTHLDEIELQLPQSSARVSLGRDHNGRRRVMLEVKAPGFTSAPPGLDELLSSLGVTSSVLSTTCPPEVAQGDFIHLVLPVADLAAMRAISPDFPAVVRYCQQHGIETVAAFCLETENPSCHLHLRDFCPAVGVAESAAAGTTNAAVSSYLHRHGLVEKSSTEITVLAEQGIELGRPSQIETRLEIDQGNIQRLWVGGIATRVFQGEFLLADCDDG